MQLVAGSPSAGDVEDDIWSAGVEEGIVDVLLKICGGEDERRGHARRWRKESRGT